MSAHASPTPVREVGLRHEALLVEGLDGLLAATVPFVRDAVAADEPVLVALIDEHWLPLRDALGPVADRVQHADMGVLGRNPARIIPAWTAFVAEHAGAGRPLRGIGEPIWAGRAGPELTECQLHEALIDVALPAPTPLWLVCPYDVEALPADVVDEAVRSHRTVRDAGAQAPSPTFTGDAHVRTLWSEALPPAPVDAHRLTVRRGELSTVRALVRETATAAGLPPVAVDELTLAVNELAANSLDHGGGSAELRVWRDGATLLCEMQDAGHLDDVLVGRTAPSVDGVRGRGMWMVNQLCDLVQIRSTSTGTVVRVHTRLADRPVR